MLRKILIVLYKAKYQLLKLNLKYDRVKEPHRMFLAIAICIPLSFGVGTRDVYLMNLSLAALSLIIGIRIYWTRLLKSNFGDKQS